MLANCWLAEKLLAFQQFLCCMELIKVQNTEPDALLATRSTALCSAGEQACETPDRPRVKSEIQLDISDNKFNVKSARCPSLVKFQCMKRDWRKILPVFTFFLMIS